MDRHVSQTKDRDVLAPFVCTLLSTMVLKVLISRESRSRNLGTTILLLYYTYSIFIYVYWF
jgi:hypothetical protein